MIYSSPYEAHLKFLPFALAKKEKHAMKSQKVTFQKSQNLLAENLHERPSIQTFISYSFNFKGGLCNRFTGYCPYRAQSQGGEQFLWFLKNDLLRFHLILFFFD